MVWSASSAQSPMYQTNIWNIHYAYPQNHVVHGQRHKGVHLELNTRTKTSQQDVRGHAESERLKHSALPRISTKCCRRRTCSRTTRGYSNRHGATLYGCSKKSILTSDLWKINCLEKKSCLICRQLLQSFHVEKKKVHHQLGNAPVLRSETGSWVLSG